MSLFKAKLRAAENNFPGKRELLGTVHTAQGEIKVYMPNMRDMKATDLSHENFHYMLSANCCGMSYQDFMDLNYPDGAAIVQLVSEAIDKLKPLINRGGGI